MPMKPVRAVMSAVLGLAGIGGCGPEPSPDWMLGVFSSDLPGPAAGRGVERYYIHENGELDYISEPSGGTWRRKWERDGDDSILMYPNPSETGFPQEIYSWRIVRKDACLLEIRRIFKGVEREEGGDLYRGEVCSRSLDSDLHGGEYENYWCEEPPPEPCGDEDE